MSFEQIKYQEIVQEEWEDSYWYETIHKRFFFVIFRRNGSGELVLESTIFWAMPLADRENAEIYWQDIKERVAADDYDNFYKSRPDRLFHVRPKARNAKDLMPTPAGGLAKKKAYWFNRTYILRIINGNA